MNRAVFAHFTAKARGLHATKRVGHLLYSCYRSNQFILWGIERMRTHPTRLHSANFWMNYYYVLLLLSVLLLTGCSNLLNGVAATDTPEPTPTFAGPSLTGNPEKRVDGRAENPLMGELAKVQQIMSSMTLDQKLGQLIIVEYLGNSYAPNLQYMIAQQYVGGFLYQAVNHNFNADRKSTRLNSSHTVISYAVF